MTPPDAAMGGHLCALAFASPDGRTWGAAVSGPGGWSVAIGPSGTEGCSVEVTEEPDGGWRLEAAALSLRAAPAKPPIPPALDEEGAPAAPVPAFVPGEAPELCRVTGGVSGQQVDWTGIRALVAPPRSGKDAPGSARFVAGWFADGSAVGLIAARPRRQERADHDRTSATLFDPDRWLPVAEPRLSTTYDGSDIPTRVNLELWVGEGEHEYPRRMAGEATGAPGTSAAGDAVLQVVPLRCHSRGEEGAGVYVLATF